MVEAGPTPDPSPDRHTPTPNPNPNPNPNPTPTPNPALPLTLLLFPPLPPYPKVVPVERMLGLYVFAPAAVVSLTLALTP